MEANEGSEASQAFLDLNRDQIKALRKIRNKEKRLKKKEDRLTEKKGSKQEIIEKSGGVTVVSREFFDNYNRSLNNDCVTTKRKSKSALIVDISKEIQSKAKISLTKEITACKLTTDPPLVANKLDNSQPVQKKGKHKEGPKEKHESRLKKDIKGYKNCKEDEKTKFLYMDNNVNENLEKTTEMFLKRIVELQEKQFLKDQMKAIVRKRLIVGFHQTRKFLLTKKVKLLIIATDIKVTDANDPLAKLIKEFVDLCKSHEILYVFSMKRRSLGKTTLKSVPVSCVGILRAEGAEGKFMDLSKEIIKGKQIYNEEHLEEHKKDSEVVYKEVLEKLKVVNDRDSME